MSIRRFVLWNRKGVFKSSWRYFVSAPTSSRGGSKKTFFYNEDLGKCSCKINPLYKRQLYVKLLMNGSNNRGRHFHSNELTMFGDLKTSVIRKEYSRLNRKYSLNTSYLDSRLKGNLISNFSTDNEVNENVDEEERKVKGSRLHIWFTCKKCSTRSYKNFSRVAYEKGIVIIRCPGCRNLHLIADNEDRLGFGSTNIESFVREAGGKLSKGEDGTFEFSKEDYEAFKNQVREEIDEAVETLYKKLGDGSQKDGK